MKAPTHCCCWGWMTVTFHSTVEKYFQISWIFCTFVTLSCFRSTKNSLMSSFIEGEKRMQTHPAPSDKVTVEKVNSAPLEGLSARMAFNSELWPKPSSCCRPQANLSFMTHLVARYSPSGFSGKEQKQQSRPRLQKVLLLSRRSTEYFPIRLFFRQMWDGPLWVFGHQLFSLSWMPFFSQSLYCPLMNSDLYRGDWVLQFFRCRQ